MQFCTTTIDLHACRLAWQTTNASCKCLAGTVSLVHDVLTRRAQTTRTRLRPEVICIVQRINWLWRLLRPYPAQLDYEQRILFIDNLLSKGGFDFLLDWCVRPWSRRGSRTRSSSAVEP